MKREPSDAGITGSPGRDDLQALIEARIRRLELTSGNGLWGMLLFLVVDGFAILPDLPEPVRQKLGAPPPVDLISLALVIYAFSGIILTLARMTTDTDSYRGFMHATFFTNSQAAGVASRPAGRAADHSGRRRG
jgi:hypothetical protein